MKELMSVYKEFWSQFRYDDLKPPHAQKKLPAFQEGFVFVQKENKIEMPDFPYLVYPAPKPNFTENYLMQINIWDRPPQDMIAIGYQDRIVNIVEQIEEQITADGAILLLANGAIQLSRGDPWINMLPGDLEDPAITRAILNVIVENYTL